MPPPAVAHRLRPWHAAVMPHSDPAAEAWLTEHGDYLYRFALARLRDGEVAADLVQETLLAAWKGRAGFAGQSSARTWLTGILKHKITDHIRRRIRERRLAEATGADPDDPFFDDDGAWREPPAAWHETPEALAESGQFRETLDRCMERLPEMQRQVFAMRELAGEENAAICKACGITTTNLHVLIHRARMALRACLELNWFGGVRRS